MSRPPPKAQFSQAVSLKQTMTLSGFNPGDLARSAMSCARICFFTFTLRPTESRISMSTKSSFRGVPRSGYSGSKRQSSAPSSSTRWNLSFSGTPEATSARCTAPSTADLNSDDLPLRTVNVTSGIAAPSCALRGLPERRDLDFDAHPRVEQVRGNHRGCRAHFAEILAQNRPAFREFLGVGKDVGHANHVVQARARLTQRGLDVLEALLRLRADALGDRHRRVVETGGARHEDPVALDDGAGVADFLLES